MNLPTPVIQITNLHKAYGDLEVLKGVDVTAQRGDVISLIGSSGSGKSTLLRCCNLEDQRIHAPKNQLVSVLLLH